MCCSNLGLSNSSQTVATSIADKYNSRHLVVSQFYKRFVGGAGLLCRELPLAVEFVSRPRIGVWRRAGRELLAVSLSGK